MKAQNFSQATSSGIIVPRTLEVDKIQITRTCDVQKKFTELILFISRHGQVSQS